MLVQYDDAIAAVAAERERCADIMTRAADLIAGAMICPDLRPPCVRAANRRSAQPFWQAPTRLTRDTIAPSLQGTSSPPVQYALAPVPWRRGSFLWHNSAMTLLQPGYGSRARRRMG